MFSLKSVLVTFSLMEQNTQHLHLKGRDIYFGSLFKSKVSWLQGKNRMAEGHGKGKVLNPW